MHMEWTVCEVDLIPPDQVKTTESVVICDDISNPHASHIN
jgi:hypothetical protein